MSKIDIRGLAEALAEKSVDEMDVGTLMQIVYEMQCVYFNDMSEVELLNEADWVGIDINQFQIEGE